MHQWILHIESLVFIYMGLVQLIFIAIIML